MRNVHTLKTEHQLMVPWWLRAEYCRRRLSGKREKQEKKYTMLFVQREAIAQLLWP